jgi:glutathione-specific gamma-glutamylcyclotransferase
MIESAEESLWVFGYGSLMWDGWETQRPGFIRRVFADLPGYRRQFNKLSVRNWGTPDVPGPTLNLQESASSVCPGIAFEFGKNYRQAVIKYLEDREGENFVLANVRIRLTGDIIERPARTPLYQGHNIIRNKSISDIALMVKRAKGRDGPCRTYVDSIAAKLEELEISDPAVAELANAVKMLPP